MENESLILETLMDMKLAQGRVEQKVDDANSKLAAIEEQTTRTNGRVSVLERWKSFQKGKMVAVSAISGGIMSIITLIAYLKWH